MAHPTDDADEDAGSAAPARPLAGALVQREKPVIEGKAEEIGVSSAPASDSETAEVASLAAPPVIDATPAEPMPNAAPREALGSRRLWPFAAAIVIAALLGMGGALALHLLDKTPGKLALLDARLAALEQRPDSTETSRAALIALDASVAALQGASRDAQTTLQSLRADLDRLAAQKAAPSAAPDLAPLEARLSALEQKLAALDAKVGTLAGRLDAEKSQVSASETQVSQSATVRSDSEAIAILAANLLRKADSGAPYDADLAALANRGLDRTKLAPLEPAAPSGLPTSAALAKQFADLTPAILATEPQPKEQGFLDHLVKGAERLVKVEKVGDATGDDLAAHVGRIQAALDAGDIDSAYQEWSALPDAAKAQSAAFGAAAKARIDAIAAAKSIDADAIAALGKAKS
jgi:hypothetical protein